MSSSSHVWFRRSMLVSTLVSLLAVSACTEVRFISEYDQPTDQQVTALQRSVETFFTTMQRIEAETKRDAERKRIDAEMERIESGAAPTPEDSVPPECSHASHDAFYQQATVDLNLLIVRNQIRTKNDITNKQLKLLVDSLEGLEELHLLADEEKRCLGMNDLGPLRIAFGAQFGGILRLELAKKRGQTEGSAN